MAHSKARLLSIPIGPNMPLNVVYIDCVLRKLLFHKATASLKKELKNRTLQLIVIQPSVNLKVQKAFFDFNSSITEIVTIIFFCNPMLVKSLVIRSLCGHQQHSCRFESRHTNRNILKEQEGGSLWAEVVAQLAEW